jgi:hypothetical protein
VLSEAEVDALGQEHAGHWPFNVPPPLATFITSDDGSRFRVSGEVDLSNRRSFARALRAYATGRTSLTIDVKDLRFADLGFFEMVFAVAALLPSYGSLRIANASDRVKRIVTVAGFHDPRVIFE